jgi:uncharacterized protein (TIGR02145 family)
LPVGWRGFTGGYMYYSTSAAFYSSSLYNKDSAWFREFNNNTTQVRRSIMFRSAGLPVRCITD